MSRIQVDATTNSFPGNAKAQLRAIDQETALRILVAIGRYMESGSGDVKQLEGYNPPRFRLRVGDWRVVFRKLGDDAIRVIGVGHRRDIYR